MTDQRYDKYRKLLSFVVRTGTKEELLGKDEFLEEIQALIPERVRVVEVESSATHTIDSDSCDMYVITAQSESTLFANPVGSPVQGQRLLIRLKDASSIIDIGWDTDFRPIGVPLPESSVASKTMYVGFVFNSTDSKWDCIAKTVET